MKSFAIFLYACVCVCVCVGGGGGGGDFSHDCWIIFDEAFLFVIGTKI